MAEVEFYDAGGNKLTGIPFGAGSSGGSYGYTLAFDGKTSTSYSYGDPTGGYAGLDLGVNAPAVAKIRYYPPGNNNQSRMNSGVFQGANALPQTIDVVSRVDASDGRSVVYAYQAITDSTLPYLFQSLTSATYSDGTKATYTYAQTFPGTRPLLLTAHDPRSQEPLKDIKYSFNTEQTNPLGVIASIINNKTNTPILTLTWVTGHVPKVNYPNGTAATYTMDASHAGKMSSKKDPAGNTTSFVYDESGFGYMIRQTLPSGRVMKYTYSPYGNLTSISPPDNRTRFWTRDDLDLVLTETDELGRTTTYTRDSNHRIIQVTYANSSTDLFTYNAFGQVLTHTLRNGATESNIYDARGMKTSSTDAAGNVTTYTYDPQDRLASATDAGGGTTSYQYNDRGQITSITFADGNSRSYAYDEFGNRTGETNELGKTWRTTYDEFQRLTARTDPLNRTTAYAYNIGSICGCALPEAKPTKITLPSGKATTFTYDGLWRKATETVGSGTADAATTYYTYDSLGNLTSMTDPNGRVWTYTYDGRDRRNSATDPLGNRTQWAYDYVGNRTSETRPDGGVTSYVYDNRYRLIRTTDPKNQVTKFTYDNADNLTSLTDPKNNTYSFAYDVLNRKTRMTYPDGSHEDWSYNASGNLAAYATRAGQVKTSTFDNRDRESGYSWSGNTAPAVAMNYDSAGRLTSLSSSVSALSYTYDDANQLLSETSQIAGDGTARTVSYTYDTDGNRANLIYPFGIVVTYSYTGRNQLATITADEPPPIATYSYDLNGNRLSKQLENGTTTIYAYDNANRLLNVTHHKAGTAFASSSYGYNAVGNRTWKKLEDSTGETYAYDAIDQVTGVQYGVSNPDTTPSNPQRTVSYSYDTNGNRTNVTDNGIATAYTTNNLNQYTTVDGVSPAYGVNGNLTRYGTWTYGYDAENRLISVSGGPNNVVATFAYDACNRCVIRSINGATAFYLYDGWSLIQEYAGAAYTEAKRYIHGGQIDELVALIDSNGTHFFHHDALGSTVRLTDVNGDTEESYNYDVYGAVTVRDATANMLPNGSAIGNRFLFTGRESIREVNLYDYRNRMYSQELGRFLQSDPIRFKAHDVNLYRYVFNNPIMFNDPMGLSSMDNYIPGLAPVFPPPKVKCDKECSLKNMSDIFFGDNSPGQRIERDNRRDAGTGGVRHCVDACLLRKCLGIIGAATRDIWDLVHEHPAEQTPRGADSRSDMRAEDIGEGIGRTGGCCEEDCLKAFPTGREGY